MVAAVVAVTEAATSTYRRPSSLRPAVANRVAAIIAAYVPVAATAPATAEETLATDIAAAIVLPAAASATNASPPSDCVAEAIAAPPDR